MQPLAQVITIILLLWGACFDWSQDNAQFLLMGVIIYFIGYIYIYIRPISCNKPSK